MADQLRNVEKRIKELVHRHRNKYENLAVGYLIAEMIVKTDRKNIKSPDIRYRGVMDTIFGKPEELPVGEKDEKLLISAGWHFCFLGYNDENIYKNYVGPNEHSTPESHACREAAKSSAYAKYADFGDSFPDLCKEYKMEIDKDAKRITEKFMLKRDLYVSFAIEQEGMKEDAPDLNTLLKNGENVLGEQLQLVDIGCRKIITSVDFNYLRSKT